MRTTTAKRRQQPGRRIPTGMQALAPYVDEDAFAGVLPVEKVFHRPFNRELAILVSVNGDHRVGGGKGIVSFFFRHGSCHWRKLHRRRRWRRTELMDCGAEEWEQGKGWKGEWRVGLIAIVLLYLGTDTDKKTNRTPSSSTRFKKSSLWLLIIEVVEKMIVSKFKPQFSGFNFHICELPTSKLNSTQRIASTVVQSTNHIVIPPTHCSVWNPNYGNGMTQIECSNQRAEKWRIKYPMHL